MSNELDKVREALENMRVLSSANNWPGLHNDAQVALAIIDRMKAQQGGEPVAWMRPADGSILSHKGKVYEGFNNYPDHSIPLYTHPSTVVELSEEGIERIALEQVPVFKDFDGSLIDIDEGRRETFVNAIRHITSKYHLTPKTT